MFDIFRNPFNMNHCLWIAKTKNYHKLKKGWPKGVMKWKKKQTADPCIHIMVKIIHLHYIGRNNMPKFVIPLLMWFLI